MCIALRLLRDVLGKKVVVVQVIRRYHIQDREDYKKYNKICGIVTKLVNVIKRLDPHDPVRVELTDQMLDKCAMNFLLSMSIVLYLFMRLSD